jgi:Peptidase family M1 domain
MRLFHLLQEKGGRREEGGDTIFPPFSPSSLLFFFPSLFLPCIFLILIFSTFTIAQPLPNSTLFDLAWNDRSIFEQTLTTEAQPILESLLGAPIYHLEWRLSDDLYHLDAKAEILITNTTHQPWNDLVFRLYPNALGSLMKTKSIYVDGIAVAEFLEAENTALRIPLLKPLGPNQQTVVSIDYTLDIAQEIEAYGRLARFENVLSLAHAYPTLSILENGKWDTDIPPPLGDPLVANSSFFLTRVYAPLEYDLITTGQETKRTLEGSGQIVEFVAGPARDFYLAAAQGYTVAQSTFGETVVRSFVPKNLSRSAQSSLTTTKQALEFFSNYFPYPYREFDVVAVPVEAGGVEYPGIVNITNGLYANPFGRLHTVIVHEVAHQWSFGLVGSDQIENPWLDETLTQYLTLRYQENLEGVFAMGYLKYWKRLWDSSSVPEMKIGLPVEAYNERSYGEIVYGKGLLFMEKLATTMGQEKLDEALTLYYRRFAWQFAEPQDFQKITEETCRCNLDNLFTFWVNP